MGGRGGRHCAGRGPGRQQRNPTEGNRTATDGAGVDAVHCNPGATRTGVAVELSMKLAMS